MKKALPFIVGAVILIIIIVVLLKRKQAADEVRSTIDQAVTNEPDFFPFPTENQNPSNVTIIAPADQTQTPPVVSGSAPIGVGCLNNTVTVALIDEWKRMKRDKCCLIKRTWIKNELRGTCPEALNYLVV